MLTTQRAVVFVHYDRDNLVDAYVYYYLQSLRALCNHLVFVTTSKLSYGDHHKLSLLCDAVIERDNIGYDFMSYKVGIESFDYHQYDELLICNDSLYGPFFPLSSLFEQMQDVQCDFWGITSNNDINYHLQSYFLLFKKNLLNASAFKDFWHNVQVLHSKDEIIEQYEAGLTSYFQDQGFNPAVAIDYKVPKLKRISILLQKLSFANIFRKLSALVKKEYTLSRIGKINVTLYAWERLLVSHHMPFLKIKLLREEIADIDKVEKLLMEISDYDVAIIKRHLERMGQKR